MVVAPAVLVVAGPVVIAVFVLTVASHSDLVFAEDLAVIVTAAAVAIVTEASALVVVVVGVVVWVVVVVVEVGVALVA
jgi:hypothetical protein